MAEQKATNVHWHEGDITREHRAGILGPQGRHPVVYRVGQRQECTVAVELEGILNEMGVLAYRLDGDNVRMGINKNLGFSAEDRTENIRRIGEVAKLFVDAGVIALSSFISPYAADRDQVRALHRAAGMDFIEVFVDCSLAAAESRDPKGLYKKARAGEIKNFTGIDDPTKPPPSRKFTSTRTSRPGRRGRAFSLCCAARHRCYMSSHRLNRSQQMIKPTVSTELNPFCLQHRAAPCPAGRGRDAALAAVEFCRSGQRGDARRRIFQPLTGYMNWPMPLSVAQKMHRRWPVLPVPIVNRTDDTGIKAGSRIALRDPNVEGTRCWRSWTSKPWSRSARSRTISWRRRFSARA